MINASNYILPVIVILTLSYSLIKGVDIFSIFIKGATQGLKTAINILPPLIFLILGVNMLKVSGALDLICFYFSPIADFLGIPEEVVPLTILSPISGSGSITMFERILKDSGPDSFPGRCASIIAGSTETTFYAITLYYGSVGIKKTRHTLPCALCADFTSFILSSKVARFIN